MVLNFAAFVAIVLVLPVAAAYERKEEEKKKGSKLPAQLHVIHGKLDGVYVGIHTSELQANVIDRYFEPIHEHPKDVSLFNATRLRRLTLTGAYLADVPLQLPSLFVLELSGGSTSITAAKNLSQFNVSRFEGILQLDDVWYSAVIGTGNPMPMIDTTPLPAIPRPSNTTKMPNNFMAIALVGGGRNSIRNVRLIANNSGSTIGINMSPNAEIGGCDIGGRGVGVGMTIGRCIWALATNGALVHDNHVHHCSKHALDFDAFTSASAAWSNLCEYNGEEGIFVEETAKQNMIFNNTCKFNVGSGIGVYSNAVGPVANNFIIGNTLLHNNGNALSAGGVGHNVFPNKYSLGNIFASNFALGNGVGKPQDPSQFNPTHGAVSGDYWVNNVVGKPQDKGAKPEWDVNLITKLANSSAFAIFEPESVLLLLGGGDDG